MILFPRRSSQYMKSIDSDHLLSYILHLFEIMKEVAKTHLQRHYVLERQLFELFLCHKGR